MGLQESAKNEDKLEKYSTLPAVAARAGPLLMRTPAAYAFFSAALFIYLLFPSLFAISVLFTLLLQCGQLLA